MVLGSDLSPEDRFSAPHEHIVILLLALWEPPPHYAREPCSSK